MWISALSPLQAGSSAGTVSASDPVSPLTPSLGVHQQALKLVAHHAPHQTLSQSPPAFLFAATHVESIVQLTHLTDEATEAGSGAAGRGRICTSPQSRKELAQGHGQSWELSTGRVAPL